MDSPRLVEADETAENDFADLDLEELMQVQVVSASRQPQPLNMSSMPVSVLSAEYLHSGGFTNVADALQFVPGLDVLYADRNRAMVGVRGLHDVYSERTLLMIDGRAAENPVLGGAEFNRLPLFIEDLERVEVAKGPGGGAWGANAFNGVINLITKRPEDTTGVLLSTNINEYGDTYSHLRVGRQFGPWAYRVSMGYESYESSEDAISGDNFDSLDSSRNARVSIDAAYQEDPEARLTFGVSHLAQEGGDFAVAGVFVGETRDNSLTRIYAKLEHEQDSESSSYLQWFAVIDDYDSASLTNYFTVLNDLEAQHTTTVDSHTVSFGANARWLHLDQDDLALQDGVFGDTPRSETGFGVFLIDRWAVDDRLTLEGQGRLDYHSETGADWSARFTGLYALDAEQQDVLRFSVARAYRAPMSNLRAGLYQRIPLGPPGAFGLTLVPNEGLDNESLVSLEGGYASQLTDELRFRADAYYQFYEDLISFQAISLAPVVAQSVNFVDAEAWGGEFELTRAFGSGEVSAWYAYHAFDADRGDNIRAFRPAEHSAGVRSRFELCEDTWLTASYRFTSSTVYNTAGVGDGTPIDVENHNLFDLALSFPIFENRGEITLGVHDVFDDGGYSASATGDSDIAGDIHPVPGRTFFIRLQARF